MKLGCGKYFGETLNTFSVSGLLLTEKIHCAGEVLPEHHHENAYFCLSLMGGWSEAVDGKSFECETSTVIYHPKEEVHQTSFHRGQISKTFNVEITTAWIENLARFNVEPVSRRIVSKDRSLTSYLTNIYTEFKRNDDFSGLAIESHVAELFVHLYRRLDKQPKDVKQAWLHEVKAILTESYLNPLSLSELAKTFHVHPVYLSTSFKKAFGLTVTDAYRQCRIEAACRLLIDSQLPLVEVALECGFYDQSHFCKHFQRAMDMTPLQYRRNPSHHSLQAAWSRFKG